LLILKPSPTNPSQQGWGNHGGCAIPNILAWAVACGWARAFDAADGEPGHTQEEQAACSGDPFRLCGPEIPDVDRVTACMARSMAQLSPGCQVYFRSGPEAAAAPAGAPMSIKPTTWRKPVSAKKAAKTDAKAIAKPGKSKRPKNPDTT
jgi:hypothetical protein